MPEQRLAAFRLPRRRLGIHPRRLVRSAGTRVERDAAGVGAWNVIVGGHLNQIVQGRARVDGQQRIKGTADRIETEGAAAGGAPGYAYGFAARIAG